MESVFWRISTWEVECSDWSLLLQVSLLQEPSTHICFDICHFAVCLVFHRIKRLDSTWTTANFHHLPQCVVCMCKQACVCCNVLFTHTCVCACVCVCMHACVCVCRAINITHQQEGVLKSRLQMLMALLVKYWLTDHLYSAILPDHLYNVILPNTLTLP